jgi:hypothetical protein
MTDLRGMKLLAATLIVCTGSLCVAISNPFGRAGSGGLLVGIVLLLAGSVMLFRQWIGMGFIEYVARLDLCLRSPHRETKEKLNVEETNQA